MVSGQLIAGTTARIGDAGSKASLTSMHGGKFCHANVQSFSPVIVVGDVHCNSVSAIKPSVLTPNHVKPSEDDEQNASMGIRLCAAEICSLTINATPPPSLSPLPPPQVPGRTRLQASSTSRRGINSHSLLSDKRRLSKNEHRTRDIHRAAGRGPRYLLLRRVDGRP
jgi:hypothetical protein